jgi:hypothetical protein
MSILSEVRRRIESLPDDAIIMADDFKHLGVKISSIQRALSRLFADGHLRRETKGAYVMSCRPVPSVDAIVERKALRFGWRIQPKSGVVSDTVGIEYWYWTSGRETRFRLWRDEPATVVLQERSRAKSDRERRGSRRQTSAACKVSTAAGDNTCVSKGAEGKKRAADVFARDAANWWHLILLHTSKVMELMGAFLNTCSTRSGPTKSFLRGEPRRSMSGSLVSRNIGNGKVIGRWCYSGLRLTAGGRIPHRCSKRFPP